jgi:uncharacterized repeat protein (TIGR02543 family)
MFKKRDAFVGRAVLIFGIVLASMNAAPANASANNQEDPGPEKAALNIEITAQETAANQQGLPALSGVLNESTDLQSSDPQCGGLMWTSGPTEPEVADQVQQELEQMGLETTVQATSYGETDGCGAYTPYGIDFTITLTDEVLSTPSTQYGKATAQHDTASDVLAVLLEYGGPNLGNVRLIDSLGNIIPLETSTESSLSPNFGALDADPPPPDAIFKNVYVIVYDPLLANGQTLREFMHWNDPAVITQQTIDFFKQASNNKLNFSVVETTIVNTGWPELTDGFIYTEQTYLPVLANSSLRHLPEGVNYNKIVNTPEFDICGKLNRGEIDEVWIYNGPWFGFYESTLVGPGGYFFNSLPVGSSHGCNKLLPIMGPSPQRALDEAIHNFTHRTESTMVKVYGSWQQNNTSHNWNKFALVQAQSANYSYSGCGSSHYPPNATSDYNYSNPSPVPSNCDDFYNYPNLSDPLQVSQSITCSAWGCTGIGYYDYWFNHMPSYPGCGSDAIANDWWKFIGNPSFSLTPSRVCQSDTRVISGNVGTGTATLSYNDGTQRTVNTDAYGNYFLIVPNNWSGSVAPGKDSGYLFTPVSINYVDVVDDQYMQGYTASTDGPEIVIKGNNVTVPDGDGTPSLSDYTDFGVTTLEGGTVSHTFTIQNTGTGSLDLSGSPTVQINGANASDFTILTQPSGPINAAGSTTFTIVFDPSDNGLRSASISISTNDSNENPYNFSIQGTGSIYPEMDIRGNNLLIADGDSSPSTSDHTNFGSTLVNGGMISRTFSIYNTGVNDLHLTDSPIVSFSGTNPGDFSVTVQPASPIAVGGVTTFTVIFNPTASGARSAVVSLANDDPNENPYNFSIQGIGTTVPEIDVQGNGVSIADNDTLPALSDHTVFGSVSTSSGTISRTYTIYNLGDGNLTLTGSSNKVTVGGTHSSNFTVTQQPSSPIIPGGSTTFTVTFDPSVNGLRTATLSILNDDSNETPYNFSIQGTGLGPEIYVTGNSSTLILDGDSTPSVSDHTDFGSINVMGTTQSRTFTIFNSGNDSLTLDGSPQVSLSGVNAGDFSVTVQPTTPIPGFSSTTFTIMFDPAATGIRTASLSISNNDTDENPYNFSIQGTGIGNPEIDIQGNNNSIINGDNSPAFTDHTDFENAPIADGSVSRTFTILNGGDANLTLTGSMVSISGTHASDFSVTAFPVSPIAPGNSSTFTILFDPSVIGPRTAFINVDNNDANENPYSFFITGTGTTDPMVDSFTVASPSSSLDIQITAFTATDDEEVIGYQVTESSTPPSAEAAGWTTTAPTTYSVAGSGSYTLYPWAKDAVGNVSALYGSPASVFVDTSAPAAGDTRRVSVDSSGVQGNSNTYFPVISDDGRYVAFDSYASNLVSGDTNGEQDIFVHDRDTGITTRVSVDSNGTQGLGGSSNPAISSDGRYVAFHSGASNLVSGDTNGYQDIFVHDRDTGATTRVSVDSSGAQANSAALNPVISSDGRFVSFYSYASNLVSGDTNGVNDIFVHDRNTGITTRVSVDSSGVQGNGISYDTSISGDGRFVAFYSTSTNLVSGDTNRVDDIFVHDRNTGITTRVSTDSSGTQGNDDSFNPAISSDGRYVAFHSSASNLVSNDTNGTLDVFVHDRNTGITTRVSVDSSGAEGNGFSWEPAFSGDGRFVTFYSIASNLVSGDTNGMYDIFVHDRDTGTTTRISVNSSGAQGNHHSSNPVISSDGRYVTFHSFASNLVGDDTNGVSDIFVYELPVPAPTTVTFNANEGTGSMSPQTASASTTLTLNTFTRMGYSFTGWNTATDGSGTAYADGASHDFSADITLYAQWMIESNAPTVTSFSTTSPSNSLDISITDFTASDDTAVTGYLITESNTPPSSSDPDWTGSPPTTYATGNFGNHTLYPWAKDAAGNVSALYGSPAAVFVCSNAVTVSSNADSGVGSLRQAIADACPGVTINFDSGLSGSTIHLASTLVLSKNVTIDGSTLASKITVSGDSDNNGSGNVRIFEVNAGVTATLNNLVVTKGYSSTFAGAIHNKSTATLTINNSTFSNNTADAAGGAILNNGTIIVNNSRFSLNTGSSGGAISNGPGSATINKSTFLSNTASTSGGAFINSGTLTIINSTFASNSANDGIGGGVRSDGASSELSIVNSTFSANGADSGGAIHHSSGLLSLSNVIMANSMGGDCILTGGSLSTANNLIEDTGSNACGLTSGSNGNIIGSDPHLGLLTGSPGFFPLLSGSQAIDAGDDGICTAAPVNNTSQNGIIRAIGDHCDIGSAEAAALIDVTIGGTNQGSYTIAAGASRRESYSGINNGPVKVESTNASPLIAAERVIYKVNGVNVSFSEMMTLPNSLLNTTYWLPWYNNVDLDTQLRIGNVSGQPASVHVYIGGVEMTGSPFALTATGAGQSSRLSFAGVNAGPVQIVSNVSIVAAERVIYTVNGTATSFSETMALPHDQLDTTYWLPWYNNVDLDTQLRIGNVSGQPASVHVYIGGVEMTGSPFALTASGAGQSTRLSFAGVNAGPVQIVSNVDIVAAERVIYTVNGTATSFSETMALPNDQLDTTYWLPWYNNVDLDTQLRIGNVSGQPASVHVYIGGVEMTGSPFALTATGAGQSTRLSFAGVNAGPVQIVSNVDIVAAERVIYTVSGVAASFSEMMALPHDQLDTGYWTPWYNNVDLDTQLRFGTP